MRWSKIYSSETAWSKLIKAKKFEIISENEHFVIHFRGKEKFTFR